MAIQETQTLNRGIVCSVSLESPLCRMVGSSPVFYALKVNANSKFASLDFPRKSGHVPCMVSLSIPACFLSGTRLTRTF
jgi:hypothetical protein